MTNESIKSMDAYILLSVINTKLRDEYSSLNLLCDDMSIDKELVESKLASVDYTYDESVNQFK
ncbi:DUF4250 domain-containing protein [Clostridium sp. SM-530-WT-3G]|uniref:DUF4250 domain-containing protein n=1 Tax=Clostridium sp. SM-530-WT-3G TaxID=2725303 RepID=UPI00145C9AE0|nr:DUF4250 domain-containing protein [Clostridium sp. SM-530-WT-3G]NME82235.1 DUF4250 domain-containing protein [Clostridium sp. SM-530-WT-3G]